MYYNITYCTQMKRKKASKYRPSKMSYKEINDGALLGLIQTGTVRVILIGEEEEISFEFIVSAYFISYHQGNSLSVPQEISMVLVRLSCVENHNS
jgi:hypothetical protein